MLDTFTVYTEDEAQFVEEAAFDLCEDCDEYLVECICEYHTIHND